MLSFTVHNCWNIELLCLAIPGFIEVLGQIGCSNTQLLLGLSAATDKAMWVMNLSRLSNFHTVEAECCLTSFTGAEWLLQNMKLLLLVHFCRVWYCQDLLLNLSLCQFGRSGKSYQSNTPLVCQNSQSHCRLIRKKGMSKTRHACVIDEGTDARVQQHNLEL